MTCSKPDHERGAKPERQEVLLDRVHGKSDVLDGHSGDHCEFRGSVCDCMDHRTIEALSVKMMAKAAVAGYEGAVENNRPQEN